MREITLGPMYWSGWALADYQWRTGFSFEEIRAFAPFNRIVDLYSTFQDYEQDRRDINSAEAATVTILASALGCAVEDLLERRFNPRTRRMI